MNKLIYIYIVLFFSALFQVVSAQGLVINEILASNITTNTDEDGSNEDWVELYNSGTTAINLNGYGLTDDPLLLYKWIFPNISMAPGTYLLIWCSDKNRVNPAAPLHTNFKISSGTDAVILTSAGGANVGTVPAVPGVSDVSYGRFPNGTGPFMYFSAVTPNAANGTVAYSSILNPPTFSHTGGFYTTSFSLTLSTTTPGATIIYTVDGSEPKSTNISGTTYTYRNIYAELAGQTPGPFLQNSYQTLNYNAPVSIINRTPLPNKLAAMTSTYDFDPDYIPTSPIFKGTVVKAKVIKPGALESKTITRTYFVTPQGINEFSIPVVSLSLNEDYFFEYNNGMFTAGVDFDNWRAANPSTDADAYNADANFRRTGETTERRGNINYFVNGAEVLNQDIGIRINGGASRAFQSKAIRLVARADYGNEFMQYPFFDDQSLTDYSRLMLRNSGNDFNSTMMRDALTQNVIKGIGLDAQSYQPAITFVNGEYWGLLNLREKYDKHYFKNVYNIDTAELDLLEDDLTATEGDDNHYDAMAAYLEANSLAIQANFDYINTQMDINNFKDYYISNIFFGNIDWPGWNTEFWRKRTLAYIPNAPIGQDGRWRTALKDMDSCFNGTNEETDHNTLVFATATNGPEYPNPPSSTLILRSLLVNPTFKNDFINRFADLMNTYFIPDRVVNIAADMKAVIQPEMPEHIARWQSVEYNWWQQAVANMQTYATQRPAFQRQHIRGKFNIANNINATLNVSAVDQGFIKINTIDILPTTPGVPAAAYPWTGIYFSNIPVKLKAVAKPGFVFENWSGASTSTNPEITVTSASSFSITAHFIPDTTVAVNAPIYFWMMDGTMLNNIPLETLAATFEATSTDALIQYQSSLVGYPFTVASPNWRKASMERRNSPTDINYIPEANNNVPFATSDMKGLQIKEPLQTGSLENTMIFNIPTTGYKDMKFSFAAINELTNATAILIDYAVNAGTPVWITTGLASTSLPLSAAYLLYDIDFSSLTSPDDNANFKIRVRFSGTNMTVDAGNRITFNNIAMRGTEISLGNVANESIGLVVYPNPFSDNINITGLLADSFYRIFTIDGKLVKSGMATSRIGLSELTSGMYLIQLQADGKTQTKKILKK